MGAVILERNSVLLVERGRAPLKGYWSLPGGLVETGERLEEAIRREIREETGLEVNLLGVVEIFERIMRDHAGRPEYHYVIVDYLAEPAGGQLRAADDAAQVRWASRRHLHQLSLTPGSLVVIEKAFRLRRRLARSRVALEAALLSAGQGIVT